MTTGWVAVTVRGRALLARTVGRAGAARIAAAADWSTARDHLAATVYGTGLDPDADGIAAHRHAIAATAWQLRVLAGWLPPGAGHLARLAVAPIEIADVERHLARFAGDVRRTPLLADDRSVAPVALGALAGIGRRIAETTTNAEVREVLAHSVWGDPGGDATETIGLGMRVAWARRLERTAPGARPWALGAAAVLAARERLAFERTIADPVGRMLDGLLGNRWHRAIEQGDPTVFARRLPEAAAWPLDGVTSADELWRAELAVLDRVARDSRAAIAGRPTMMTAISVFALLLVDLWRVTAAIEAVGAETGALDVVSEVLDAVAA